MAVIVSEFEVVDDKGSSPPEPAAEEEPKGDDPGLIALERVLRALEHGSERASRVAAS